MRAQPVRQSARRWLGGLLLCLLPVLPVAAQDASPVVDAPEYRIERCCDLCAMASDPAAYNTGFLESFRTLVQGDNGWLFRSKDDLRSHFGPDQAGMQQLQRFVDALARKGVQLVMVYQPPRGLMHWQQLPPLERARYPADMARVSYRFTLQRLRDLGIVVPPFERLVDEPGKADFYFRRDHHWTPEGARRAAALTAEAIRDLPAYASISRQSFQTRRAGLLGKSGTLQKAARQICGFDYPDQYVEQFRTTGGGDASGLLGETRAPEIVLVGTSNSDPAYNFAGFLQEALETEVLNTSIAGGGFDGALYAYLPTEAFQDNLPKVLIWELASYHNLSDQSFYRQAIPMVSNGCADQRALISRREEIAAGRTEVLFNGDGEVLPLKGRDLQVDLQFSDPTVQLVRAVIWYTNGRKETVKIEHSKYVDARGRFMFELRDDGDWGDLTFLSMDLQMEQAPKPGTTVQADLCHRPDAQPATVQASRS